MEDPPSPATTEQNWTQDFAAALSQQRGRAEEFLAAQRERMDRAQTELAEQVQRIAQELERSRGESDGSEDRFQKQSEELDRRTEAFEQLKAELESRQAEWDAAQQRAAEHYGTLSEQIKGQQDELAEGQKSLDERRAEIDAAGAQLHHDRQALELEREEHAAQTEHVNALKTRLEGQLADLEKQQEEAAADRTNTELQRRRIAEEFKAQRAAHLKEIQRQRAELENRDAGESGRLEQQLQGVEQQRDRLQEELEAKRNDLDQKAAELNDALHALEPLEREIDEKNRLAERQAAELEAAEARQIELQSEAEAARQGEAELTSQLEVVRNRQVEVTAELETSDQRAREAEGRLEAVRQRQVELGAELETAQQEKNETTGELESLQKECQRLRKLADSARAGEGEDSAALESLRAERDRLAENLSAAEARMAGLVDQLSQTEEQLERAKEGSFEGVSDEDLQRRYEMALDDVRELKAKNRDLESELTTARSAGGDAPAASSGGGLDWEAEKRRIFAELDDDFDGDNEEDAEERVKIEDVINKTEQTLAEKEREINDLQELLNEQSSNLGSVAVGAAALGEMLDKDAVIQEERENLRRLQTEWEEKLRKAEIDMSVERAKIARERAEIEEKLQSLSKLGAMHADGDSETVPTEKPARGRWLSRLGLKDDEQAD